MPAPHHPTCSAVLWNSGLRCDAPAQPGAHYCPEHLSLLSPLEWQAGEYSPELDQTAQPLFREASFVTLADEVALARVQLRVLLREKASANQGVEALRVVAMLVRLQRLIEQPLSKRPRT